MVLTFTGSIRVADAGREDVKTLVTGAVGCNLAWGVVEPRHISWPSSWALGISTAVAILMLFVLGWLLGRYAGRPQWRTGLAMVGAGVIHVAITMAPGG